MIDGIGENCSKRLIVKNRGTLSSRYFNNSEWMGSEEMVHIWALELSLEIILSRQSNLDKDRSFRDILNGHFSKLIRQLKAPADVSSCHFCLSISCWVRNVAQANSVGFRWICVAIYS